jgi:hypothetical protein
VFPYSVLNLNEFGQSAIQGRRLGFDERNEVGDTAARQNNTMKGFAFAPRASGWKRSPRAAHDAF